MMEREEFLAVAGETALTERQAEAFWHRHVAGDGRQRAAELMGTSPSSVDNLERAARDKIMRSHNLVKLAKAVDAIDESGEPDPIATCPECDEPTTVRMPHPDDSDLPMEDQRMVCSECHEELTADE